MELFALAFTFAGAIGGALLVVSALRRPQIDAAAVLAGLDDVADIPLDEYTERLSLPLTRRLVLPAGKKIAGMVGSLLPGNRLRYLRKRLVLAGLSDAYTAEEYYAIQAIGFGVGLVGSLVLAAVFGWSAGGTLRAAPIAALAGMSYPRYRLNRQVDARQGQIKRDLPDVLDLLAISVEAGVGLEGAIEVVTHHFDSPLAHEMGRMLREMELGLSRREALQNLRRRCEVTEVSNFVLSLVQADALGMPLGRILRIQSNEMRSKRRQWAREKAAKLPVKIIFPLLTFIFPALFVVILGPAVISIAKNIL